MLLALDNDIALMKIDVTAENEVDGLLAFYSNDTSARAVPACLPPFHIGKPQVTFTRQTETRLSILTTILLSFSVPL